MSVRSKLRNIYEKWAGSLILAGLAGLFWLLVRTGVRPSRFAYPCQRVAAGHAAAFIAISIPMVLRSLLSRLHRWKFSTTLRYAGAMALVAAIVGGAYLTDAGEKRRSITRQRDQDRHPPIVNALDVEPAPATRAPIINSPTRVVHVYDENATSWDYSTGYYGDYVDQDVVNDMFDQGLMALTDAGSAVAAWNTILPNYQPGESIAIKINLNNGRNSYSDVDNQIDSLVQPVNAALRGLIQMGVAPSDIHVYDASVRIMYDNFVCNCSYDVNFYDGGHAGGGDEMRCDPQRAVHETLFSGSGPNANIYLTYPGGSIDKTFTDVVVDADYLIDFAVLKKHGYCSSVDCYGLTGALKNQLGSLNGTYHTFHA